MQDYKELKVWEKAHQFTLQVYEATKAFPKDELNSLTNQLRRAAASVPANIAEGSGKNTRAAFAHFLNTALGSANESEYFLILSKDLNYLNGKF
jgi:four helix bundle protein